MVMKMAISRIIMMTKYDESSVGVEVVVGFSINSSVITELGSSPQFVVTYPSKNMST